MENLEQTELYNKDAKDLILEDYRYFGESLRKNEESGETRVNFYLTVLAAIPVAIVALSDKKDGAILDIPDVQQMLLITLTSFFIFGIFIFLRLLKRNKITDELKFSLDNLRQQYKDIYDPFSFLNFSILPQIENSMVSIKKKKGRFEKRIREWGSLAHLVTLLNSMVLASIFFIVFHNNVTMAYWISFSAFLLMLIAHKLFIIYRETITKEKINTNRFTHAGGIVFRQINKDEKNDKRGKIEYLIITNSLENQVKDGKKYLFPRGHIEQGEEIALAGLREVYEETGAVARIIKSAGNYFYLEDSKITNVIKLYLMELLYQGQLKEDREVYWLPFEQAYDRLSFNESKGILIQSHSFLLSNILIKSV